jgi:hypothetical protein
LFQASPLGETTTGLRIEPRPEEPDEDFQILDEKIGKPRITFVRNVCNYNLFCTGDILFFKIIVAGTLC